jgi:hypothetical protein
MPTIMLHYDNIDASLALMPIQTNAPLQYVNGMMLLAPNCQGTATTPVMQC